VRFSITTLSITTLSIITLCYYAECHVLFIVMLNVIMLSVIMLNVVMLNVVMLSVVAPKNLLSLQKKIEAKKQNCVAVYKKMTDTQLFRACLFLSAFWSVFLRSANGDTCRDFTFGDCQNVDIFEIVNDVNETICQRYCVDVFDVNCEFFVFDFQQSLCQERILKTFLLSLSPIHALP
jgi:hypothetical protein